MAQLWDIRSAYTKGRLDEQQAAAHPFTQFHAWFEEYRQSGQQDPNIMTLATVDAQGQPWARVVLLKSYDERGFVFYTNYGSFKGQQLAHNPQASLHFLWLSQERQIQIQGKVEKISVQESAAYFHSRPRLSQLGAWASKQSQPLDNRQQLDQQYAEVSARFAEQEIPLPEFWGGYLVKPQRLEFWQGGANRLHDRVEYVLDTQGEWHKQRLNP